jgi:NADPH:quinone reductase-like Zn-dependent oxidoreductase
MDEGDRLREADHMDEGDHMKAVIIRGYGGPDVIELADVPVPQPGTGQVRIRVRAAPVHLTADQALDLLALRSGQWLLATGAAGAVGGFALELAALRGLRTVAVAAPDDEELVRRLGADEFIARTQDLDAVRDKGAFVAVAAGAAPVPLRGTRVHNVWIHTDGPRLAELAALVDAGQLTPRVAATLPLEQVATAHQRVAAGGLRGRIVLTLDG